MKAANFLGELNWVLAKSRVLSFLVFVIGGVVLFDAWRIETLFRSEKIVLVPVGLDRRVWVSGERASDEYLRRFARDIAGLAFSYTPANVRAQFTELLTYFPPSLYRDNQQRYYAFADTVMAKGVVSEFHIESYETVETAGGAEIALKGTRVLYPSSDPSRVVSSPATYRIRYRITDARIVLLSLSDQAGVKEGDRP